MRTQTWVSLAEYIFLHVPLDAACMQNLAQPPEAVCFDIVSTSPSLRTAKLHSHVSGRAVAAGDIQGLRPGFCVQQWPLSGVLLTHPQTGASPRELCADFENDASVRPQKRQAVCA